MACNPSRLRPPSTRGDRFGYGQAAGSSGRPTSRGTGAGAPCKPAVCRDPPSSRIPGRSPASVARNVTAKSAGGTCPTEQRSSPSKPSGIPWRSQAGRLRPPSNYQGRFQQAPSSLTARSPCPEVCQAPTAQLTAAPRVSWPRSILKTPGAPRGRTQKIVLLPGDINPHETTIITVEAPPTVRFRSPSPSQMRSPPRSPQQRSPSPCSLYPPAREPVDPTAAWCDAMEARPQRPDRCPSQSTFEEAYGGQLIDAPPMSVEPGFPLNYEGSEDLICWDDPQDPFSPPRGRAASPPCQNILFHGKQDPFSPPTLMEYFTAKIPNYQKYCELAGGGGPEMNYRPAPFVYEPPQIPQSPLTLPRRQGRRSPTVVDREVLARSVPHNREVAAICKDLDSSDDDDDLGLIPEEFMDDDFDQPLDSLKSHLEAEACRKKYERVAARFEECPAAERLARFKEKLRQIEQTETPRTTRETVDGQAIVNRCLAKLRGDRAPCEPSLDLPQTSQYEEEDLRQMQMDFEDFTEIDNMPCD